jgi:hypothetical protein
MRVHSIRAVGGRTLLVAVFMTVPVAGSAQGHDPWPLSVG